MGVPPVRVRSPPRAGFAIPKPQGSKTQAGRGFWPSAKVRRMLAKEPERRYQSIHEVCTDLNELMREIPVVASPKGYRRLAFAGDGIRAPVISPRAKR